MVQKAIDLKGHETKLKIPPTPPQEKRKKSIQANTGLIATESWKRSEVDFKVNKQTVEDLSCLGTSLGLHNST